jgi:hypothetical protein
MKLRERITANIVKKSLYSLLPIRNLWTNGVSFTFYYKNLYVHFFIFKVSKTIFLKGEMSWDVNCVGKGAKFEYKGTDLNKILERLKTTLLSWDDHLTKDPYYVGEIAEKQQKELVEYLELAVCQSDQCPICKRWDFRELGHVSDCFMRTLPNGNTQYST